MENMKKRLHQALPLETKLQILQELDGSGLSKTEVAKKFGIPKSTLLWISKNKEAIEWAVKNGTFMSKRMRMTPYEELEKVLFLWFKHARSANFPISGPILEQKAREIALQMGIENFAVSDGRLSRFQASSLRLSQEYEAIDENSSTCREKSLEELIAEAQGKDQPSSSDECDDLIPSAVVPDNQDRMHTWRRAKPRNDRILQATDHVYEKHFKPNLVSKTWTAEYKGHALASVLRCASLENDAVLIRFLDSPPYQSKTLRTRKWLAERQPFPPVQ
ncbi:hypothetical protein HPB49_001943 [Dermacentor silvarum]|uniref:Uncharacterized protein n=1 Tax=Dermacentor silvarum TaxID=543639 RepID=A0ACB8D9T9_DERSI|nr:hypothetical protein HPB49_001943 [Dermacentor silvarum]